MRVDSEYVYQEHKERGIGAFNILGDKNYETVDKITDWMTDDELLVSNSTSLALWIISIGEYEVRHNILEDRTLE